MPVTKTPLRYPGGKSRLFSLMARLLAANGLTGGTWAEPFCGGAGLAMALLLEGCVSRVVLADADPAVAAFWQAVRERPEDLCAFIGRVDLDLVTWRRCHDLWAGAAEPSFGLACACLFLSRTNRAGILGARPMGGLGQTGPWALSDRFNRQDLEAKVRSIAALADRIEMRWCDATAFMAEIAPALGPDAVCYLDPPYVAAGPGLYRRSFSEGDHRALAEALGRHRGPWALSYDACPLVDELYGPYGPMSVPATYTAQRKRAVAERLVLAGGLRAFKDGLGKAFVEDAVALL